MNYGEVRMMCRKMVGPSVDPDILDAWISGRYQSILDRLSWQRIDKEAVLQTSEPYTTGTVDVVNGSTSITGTDTVFTSAMTGRTLRISGDDAVYQFTRVSDTSGTLDRAYEGSTATECEYSIYENVLLLPEDARIVPDDGLSSFTGGALIKTTKSEIRRMSPNGNWSGVPQFFAPYLDDSSNRMSILVFPYPDAVMSLQLSYTAELTTPTSTATTLLPWMRPAAILAGVQAEASLAGRDFTAAEAYEMLFEKRVAEMVRNDTHNQPPEQVHMADRFTRHRAARWNR